MAATAIHRQRSPAAREANATGGSIGCRPRASRWSTTSPGLGDLRSWRLSSRSKTAALECARRFRSPPNMSALAPAHATAVSAARLTSSSGQIRGAACEACRLATQMSESRRVNAIVRRSGWRRSRGTGLGRRTSSRRSAILSERTRVTFDPPSPDLIRSGLRRAIAVRSHGRLFRAVRARWNSASQSRARGAAQRGGASCSIATSQEAAARIEANSEYSSRFT